MWGHRWIKELRSEPEHSERFLGRKRGPEGERQRQRHRRTETEQAEERRGERNRRENKKRRRGETGREFGNVENQMAQERTDMVKA